MEPGQLPHLALFSTRLIPAGQELMWDYGIKDTEENRIKHPWKNITFPQRSDVDGRQGGQQNALSLILVKKRIYIFIL